MKLVNIMLAVGGGRDHSFPKEGVTAAEIAVLRAIHGEDAVFDIEPTDADAPGEEGGLRSNREERARLVRKYGGAKDGEGQVIVAQLFPGAAARVFEEIDELGLPEEFFKALTRAKAEPAPKKGKKAAPAPAAPEKDAGEGEGVLD
jgi:hypothetical protein